MKMLNVLILIMAISGAARAEVAEIIKSEIIVTEGNAKQLDSFLSDMGLCSSTRGGVKLSNSIPCDQINLVSIDVLMSKDRPNSGRVSIMAKRVLIVDGVEVNFGAKIVEVGIFHVNNSLGRELRGYTTNSGIRSKLLQIVMPEFREEGGIPYTVKLGGTEASAGDFKR